MSPTCSVRPSSRSVGVTTVLALHIRTAGPVYAGGALLLGVGLLACAMRFAFLPSASRARVVLWASLIYLPGLLALLVVDGITRN